MIFFWPKSRQSRQQLKGSIACHNGPFLKVGISKEHYYGMEATRISKNVWRLHHLSTSWSTSKSLGNKKPRKTREPFKSGAADYAPISFFFCWYFNVILEWYLLYWYLWRPTWGLSVILSFIVYLDRVAISEHLPSFREVLFIWFIVTGRLPPVFLFSEAFWVYIWPRYFWNIVFLDSVAWITSMCDSVDRLWCLVDGYFATFLEVIRFVVDLSI